MASNQITLFDLPCKGHCGCWSPNPWKARMMLNFKGVDYKTEWLEYPEVKPRLQDHVKLPEGTEMYTIPTVILPDGTYVMDSLAIAKKLEELYPEPKLAGGIETPAHARLDPLVLGAMGGLRAVFFSLLPDRLLNEASVEYWQVTRTPWLGLGGKRPDAVTDAERDAAWADVAERGLLREVTALLAENAARGPYFAGEHVGFADFQWAGFLVFWKRIGDAEFEKILELTGDKARHLKFLEDLAPYIERDD